MEKVKRRSSRAQAHPTKFGLTSDKIPVAVLRSASRPSCVSILPALSQQIPKGHAKPPALLCRALQIGLSVGALLVFTGFRTRETDTLAAIFDRGHHDFHFGPRR